jgi:thioredoxin-dependent peroxiredoxin
MQAFQRDLELFEKLHAQVLGVSSDNLATHERYAKELGLTMPLLADDGRIRQSYGGGRLTYLIDTCGIIRLVQKGMPDVGSLLAEIRRLQ